MDLTTILLSLAALLAILLFCAALLYCLCYLTGKDGEEDEEPKGKISKISPAKLYSAQPCRTHRDHHLTEGRTRLLEEEHLFAGGKQMLCSTLHRSATDSDVILATATSAIPLKELGGRNNDVIVDVSQQLLFNKDDEARQEERQCIVCRTRKEITWSQVSCYAQTTIGVLVYKRTLAASAPGETAQQVSSTQPPPSPSPNVSKSAATSSSSSSSSLAELVDAIDATIERKQSPSGRLTSSTGLQSPSATKLQSDILTTNFITDRSQSLSTTTLAPEPDSRLDIRIKPRQQKQQQQQLIQTGSQRQIRSPQQIADKSPQTTKNQQQSPKSPQRPQQTAAGQTRQSPNQKEANDSIR